MPTPPSPSSSSRPHPSAFPPPRRPSRQAPLLSTPSLYVLLALMRGPRHAYDIKGAAYSQSLRALDLADGTLYPLLRRMVASGLITEAGRAETSSGRMQMHYELTPDGRYELTINLKRLRHAVQMGEAAGLFMDELAPDIRRLLEELK